MRPLSCLAFLGILCLAASAHATAMSIDGPSLAPSEDSTSAVSRELATEPGLLLPNVGFEATGATVDVWGVVGNEDPLPPASRDFGVTTETATASAPACSDGIDNDGDGHADFPDDPGCITPGSVTEQPRCQDGIDTDEDGSIDFDGGASLNGGVPLGPPDPQCAGAPWRYVERP